MLGKLLKHEFVATGKVLPISYVATAIFFLLGWLAKTIFKDAAAATVTPIVFIALSILFIAIFTYIVIISRFHKSMFGNEGYLTQTLPVKKSTLFVSRIIVFVTWYIVSMAVIIASVIGLIALTTGDWQSVWEMIKLCFEHLPELCIYFICTMIISTIEFVFIIFFSMCLANTSKFLKNNIAMSFVFYIVLSTIISILQMIAMMFIPLSIKFDVIAGESSLVTTNMLSWMIDDMTNTADAAVGYIGIGNIFLDIAIIIVLCILTNWLMKKKINVK